ncbi:MAG: DUF499 domain-containing protein, partial [Anaerolineae bacterium]|nr:DUF499 domain-containing protein [Anaerolineae bacterium]
DFYAGGREVDEGFTVYTLWGEIAYRLGGAPLYEQIRDSDREQKAPGIDLLRQLLTDAGPNLILIDELLHYVDKAAAVKVGDSNLATQTLGFLRELTEAVDAVEHSVLVASITASRMEDLEVLSGEDAEMALSKLEDILRRVEDARTPIEGSEIYDIVRARLFETVDEAAAAQVAAAYAAFYKSEPWRDLLPQVSREPEYEALLRQAYPFHPSIVQVLYERWGSRPQFQLTRGTLRFLSHLLASLWPDDERAVGPLIHLADVDLGDEDVRAEALRVAGSEWESVMGSDVAAVEKGQAPISRRADQERGGLYTRYGLTQGVATSVFMFTHGGQQTKPTPLADVRLAVARPEIPSPDLHQAMDDCAARLYFYYQEDGGAIFKTEPNPNKVLADARADFTTDDARRQVEKVVGEVVGGADLFHVTLYSFYDSTAQEPGDVPDDGSLQLVVLPPRWTASKGKVGGQAADVLEQVAENYGKRLRLNRNMILFLVPDSEHISGALDRAIDWLAANRVLGDAGLMERFSEAQQDTVRDRATQAKNDTKDHVRKAYNTILLPAGGGKREAVELSYVPPNKTVLKVALEDLMGRGKLHQEFNPALFAGRWESLWPKTATVITTEALWEKFARRGESPILTGVAVLQETIRAGVERELFGYGVMHDAEGDKLKAASYERVYLGPFDARELDVVEISGRAMLLRPQQVDTLFPPLAAEEVAMVLQGPRQVADAVFHAARESLTVQGRVDRRSFFEAVCAGVKAGLFGYADALDGPVVRGAELAPEQVRFAGYLIGEDVPLPVTVEEVALLVPVQGRRAVADLYQQALTTYGTERVSEQGMLASLRSCVAEGRFGYAVSTEGLLQTGEQEVALAGYVGQPELPPPDTRLIRMHGSVSQVDLANVIKTAMGLSKLGESRITLDLRLELKGEVNEHAVQMALNELRGRVKGVTVEDVEGGEG